MWLEGSADGSDEHSEWSVYFKEVSADLIYPSAVVPTPHSHRPAAPPQPQPSASTSSSAGTAPSDSNSAPQQHMDHKHSAPSATTAPAAPKRRRRIPLIRKRVLSACPLSLPPDGVPAVESFDDFSSRFPYLKLLTRAPVMGGVGVGHAGATSPLPAHSARASAGAGVGAGGAPPLSEDLFFTTLPDLRWWEPVDAAGSNAGGGRRASAESTAGAAPSASASASASQPQPQPQLNGHQNITQFQMATLSTSQHVVSLSLPVCALNLSKTDYDLLMVLYEVYNDAMALGKRNHIPTPAPGTLLRHICLFLSFDLFFFDSTHLTSGLFSSLQSCLQVCTSPVLWRRALTCRLRRAAKPTAHALRVSWQQLIGQCPQAPLCGGMMNSTTHITKSSSTQLHPAPPPLLWLGVCIVVLQPLLPLCCRPAPQRMCLWMRAPKCCPLHPPPLRRRAF
jgi:hypothetical protein